MKHSLKDSYVYSILDLDRTVNNIGTNINPKLEDYLISPDQLASIVNDFKYKITGYGKERVIEFIQRGDILFVDAPGINLPSWCINKDGRIVAVCNLFGKIVTDRNKGTIGRYQPKEIFGLAIVAYIFRTFFTSEPKILANSQILVNAGAVYTRMIMTLLDSLFSLSTENGLVRYTAVTYLVAKFYYRRVAEKQASPDQEVSNIVPIVKSVIISLTSIQASLDVTKNFPEQAFNSLPEFIKALSDFFPQLRHLETNLFIRKMITTYGEKSILMLENMPYLLAYSVSSLYATNLLKDYRMINTLGVDNGTKMTSNIFGMDSSATH